jgi:hypothetical protein
VTGQEVEQHRRRAARELGDVAIDRRQAGRGEAGDLEVVEAGDRHVVRHAVATRLQRVHKRQALVVAAADAGHRQRAVTLQELRHRDGVGEVVEHLGEDDQAVQTARVDQVEEDGCGCLLGQGGVEARRDQVDDVGVALAGRVGHARL